MATGLITDKQKHALTFFLQENKKCDLVTAYVFFMQDHLQVKPVIYPGAKKIYENADAAIRCLEEEGSLWREGEVRISFTREAVNEETKRIYLCPFCGKAYGDNTYANPQDMIYEHVGGCSENKERQGGLRVKRFNVSEDPEMIKNYITERKEPITKTVFSSVVTGKLFNSRAAVLRDFKENHLKSTTVVEALGQNRFEIEEHFLAALQEEISEEKLGAFVEELAEDEAFEKDVARWTE